MADPLFQGLTRPPMLLGVPLTPLVVVGLGLIMLSFYTTFWLIALFPPIVLVMKLVVSDDDRAFHILWLEFQAKAPAVGKLKLGKTHVYSPFSQKAKKNGK